MTYNDFYLHISFGTPFFNIYGFISFEADSSPVDLFLITLDDLDSDIKGAILWPTTTTT